MQALAQFQAAKADYLQQVKAALETLFASLCAVQPEVHQLGVEVGPVTYCDSEGEPCDVWESEIYLTNKQGFSLAYWEESGAEELQAMQKIAHEVGLPLKFELVAAV